MMMRRAHAKVRPTRGLYAVLWVYMRLSAVAMLGLVLGHLYIMHVINSTDTIDFAFVAQRLSTPFWRIYDILLLSVALSHGLIGMRGILDDYIHHRAWRVGAETALWILGGVFFVMGTVVLLTFQPGTLGR